MFACLSLPASMAEPSGVESDALEAVARAFSPRVEVHASRLVTLDISGLRRLLGTPADIGRELARDARERGCPADVAIAASRTAAMLLALACDGLTVVPPGEERRMLAPLPLGVLRQLAVGQASRLSEPASRLSEPASRLSEPASRLSGPAEKSPNREIAKSKNESLPVVALFRRWGLRTLGDLAALPGAGALGAHRAGRACVAARRARRGPRAARRRWRPRRRSRRTLDLDWPVEGLEPLSFVLARLLEPICERLERLDQAAVVLDLSFRLADARAGDAPPPAARADARREGAAHAHPAAPRVAPARRRRRSPGASRVETAPARIVQFSLLGARAAVPRADGHAARAPRRADGRAPRRRGGGRRLPPAGRVRDAAVHGGRRASVRRARKLALHLSACMSLRRVRLPVAAARDAIRPGGRCA